MFTNQKAPARGRGFLFFVVLIVVFGASVAVVFDGVSKWLFGRDESTQITQTNPVQDQVKGETTEQPSKQNLNAGNQPQVLGRVKAAEDEITENSLVFRLKVFFLDTIHGVSGKFDTDVEVGNDLTVGNDVIVSNDLEVGGDLIIGDTIITPDGITAENIIYSLTAGTGVSLSGTQDVTITNTDLGSSQNIFKNFKIGSNTISASSNDDTLTWTSGTGISLSNSGKTITISASGSDLNVSGWTDDGTAIRLTTSTDNVGIGTATPGYKLHVVGTSYFSGQATFAGGTVISSGIDNSSGGITNAGPITGATGLTSSGTITFSGLSTGIVHSNVNGVLSSSALNLAGGSNEVTGVLPTTNGGTGLSSYTTGDIIYSSATNTLTKLGIGATDEVLTVAGGVPTWATITGGGGLCSNCLVDDPGSTQTITPTAGTAIGLVVKQASVGSVDVFRVESNDGTNVFFKIDSSGNVTLGNQTSSGVFTVSPTSTDPISISPVAQGAGQFTGTITSDDLTAARTWTFPDATGSVCLTTGNCAGVGGQIGGSGTTNYIAKFSNSANITNSLLYDDGNNVGLGTSSPVHLFQVTGAKTGKALTVLNETGNQAIFVASASGTNRFIIQNDGNVGIGTSTPTSLLHVNGAVDFDSKLGVSGATTLGSTLDVTGLATFGGNVGIGSAAPTASLDTTGDIVVGGNDLYFGNTSTGIQFQNAGSGELRISGSGSEMARLSNAGLTFISSSTATGRFSGGKWVQLTASANASARNMILQASGTGLTASNSWSFGAYFGGDAYTDRVFGVRNDGRTLIGNNGGLAFPAGMLEIYPANTTDVALVLTGISSQTGDYINVTSSGGSAGDYLTLDASGNLGIGTTTPGAKIEVSGSPIRVSNGSSTSSFTAYEDATHYASFSWDGNNNLGVISTDGGGLSLTTNTGAPITMGRNVDANSGIDVTGNLTVTSGNVGIGTTSPASELHLASGILTLPGTFNGTNSIVIGTTGDRVEIMKTNTSGSGLTFTSYNDSTGYTWLTQDSSAAPFMNRGLRIGTAQAATGLQFSDSSAGYEWQVISSGRSLMFQNDHVNSSPTWPRTYMSIDQNGNVGIGTTVPTGKLNVSGATTGKALAIFNETGDQDIFVASASGTNRFKIQRDGSVIADSTASKTTTGSSLIWGSGNTTSGATSLTVALGDTNTAHTSGGGSTSVAIGRRNSSGASDSYTFGAGLSQASFAGMQLGFDNNNGFSTLSDAQVAFIQIQASLASTPYIAFNTASSTRMYINESGNVGIGSSSPVGKLNVEGAATGKALAILNETGNQAIFVASASGTNRLIIQNDGNVGIGSTAPVARLSIGAGSSGTSAIHLATNSTNSNIQSGGYATEIDFGYGPGTGLAAGDISLKGGTVGTSRGVGVSLNYVDASFKVVQNAASITSPIMYLKGAATPGADYFQIRSSSASNGDILAVNSAGNVGIGTSTPAHALEVNGNIALAQFLYHRGDTDTYFRFGTNQWQVIAGGVQFFEFDGGATNIGAYNYNNLDVDFRIDGDTNDGVFFVDGALENIGIGTTVPGAKLHLTTDAADYAAEIYNDGNATTRAGLLIQAGLDDQTAVGPSTLIQFNDGDGGAVGSITFGNSLTAYNTSSDVRLKDVSGVSSKGLSDLMNINVYDYSFKADSNKRLHTGFLAQELYQIYPDAVTAYLDDTSKYWQVDYGKLTPLIIKSIQDQQKQIESLALEIDATGKVISHGSKEVTPDESESAEVLKSSTIQDLSSHATISDLVWTFIQEVVFTVKTTFLASVEFVKDVTFRGSIKFSGDTVGKFVVPAGALRVEVPFDFAFSQAPTVYLSAQSQIIGGYSLESVSTSGFVLKFEVAQTSEKVFDWLAVLSSDENTATIKVLEESSTSLQSIDNVDQNGEVGGATTEGSTDTQEAVEKTPSPEPEETTFQASSEAEASASATNSSN